MEKDLKIRIGIDKKTGELKVVNGELNQIANTTKKAHQSVDTFGSSLMDLGTKVAGIYAVKEAFDAVVATGFKFNKNMEDSIAGLTALTVATSSNISAMGKHLSITEKYNLAQKEAVKTAQELQAINAQTPHSLEQTTQIYKAMYVSMKKAGASNKDMINLTKEMSIAAGAGGVQFNELLAGVDGLATGTVLANSDLGRFLSSLGLTNKKLKESKDVVGLLNSKLKDFKAVDTMTVAVSNLDNAWQQLTGNLSKDLFNESKNSIKSLSSALNSLGADLHENIYQYEETAKTIGLVSASLVGAKVAMMGYSKIALISTASNAVLGGSYGAVNRSILLATASTRALSIATKAIPYVALASGIYGVYEAINMSHDGMTIAERDMNDYAKSIKNATTECKHQVNTI